MADPDLSQATAEQLVKRVAWGYSTLDVQQCSAEVVRRLDERDEFLKLLAACDLVRVDYESIRAERDQLRAALERAPTLPPPDDAPALQLPGVLEVEAQVCGVSAEPPQVCLLLAGRRVWLPCASVEVAQAWGARMYTRVSVVFGIDSVPTVQAPPPVRCDEAGCACREQGAT